MHLSKLTAAIAVFVTFGLFHSCSSTRSVQGSVLVRTPGGAEQGVHTPLGTVFLGRTAQSGPCDVTIFFGDGPSTEPGRIHNLDGGISRVDFDLKAPTAELSMYYPEAGDDLILALADEDGVDLFHTRAAVGNGVSGTAIEKPSGFPVSPSSIGAGVFRKEDMRYRLVGLVTGVARFSDASGNRREVLTYLGPRDLLPLWLDDRARGKESPAAHRDDIRK